MLLFQTKIERVPRADTLGVKADTLAKLGAAKKAIMADKDLSESIDKIFKMHMRDKEGKISRELSDLYFYDAGAYHRLMNMIYAEANRLAQIDTTILKIPYDIEKLPFNKEKNAKVLPLDLDGSPREKVTGALKQLNRAIFHITDILTDYEKFSKMKKKAVQVEI